MGTAVSRWSMLCFAALRKQKSSSWKVLLPRLVKYSCIVFEEIVFTLPKCHEWLSGLEIMLRWISWLQPAIGMVFMCSNFPARQCGFVWVCIQNDECDRGWRWLTMLQWHDMDLYEHWYYPSWYWQHALLYCTWKVSPICVYLNSWQHEVLLNDLDWKHIGDRPRRLRGAFSVRICKGMLLWSLKSWQHKCYSTSWLYKTHKQEVMHKLGSKHNIQSWVAFSLGHDSYSRSQCTQKKFTVFTLLTLANAFWLGMVSSHYLVPCFKSHPRAWRQVLLCWLQGPQSLSQAVSGPWEWDLRGLEKRSCLQGFAVPEAF